MFVIFVTQDCFSMTKLQTLLTAFMGQGVPLVNIFNLIYVAAEVLKTLVGSFGLVTVAPFTAVIGSIIFTSKRARLLHSGAIDDVERAPALTGA